MRWYWRELGKSYMDKVMKEVTIRQHQFDNAVCDLL